MMDEVFGETNRVAIINWQKTTPKNDAGHVSVTTEYVLVYAKDKTLARTASLERGAKSNVRFANVDGDLISAWKQDNLTARSGSASGRYALQSPFTGHFHHSENRFWAYKRSKMKAWLEEWGSAYQDADIGDGRGKALVLKGWTSQNNEAVLAKAAAAAHKRLKTGNWPFLYWGMDGMQKPVRKTHELLVKTGAVPTSFWIEPDDQPLELGAVSWLSAQSGRSRDGIEELSSVVGKDHHFETVKPLKLIKKIIQIWCPHNGVVLDPYAGSGTTGHAVLELNNEASADRRFILIEQGRPDNGDKYARTLTWQRLKNAITGERPDSHGKLSRTAPPLNGGFEFRALTSQIDAKAVLSMKKDELIDVVITSHWDTSNRNSPNLIRVEDSKASYLVGKNEQGEGYFIIWNNGGPVGQLDVNSYNTLLQDAKKADLKPPYHVYARHEVYQSKNVRFYKIPDKILAHLGLNENSDSYNDQSGEWN